MALKEYRREIVMALPHIVGDQTIYADVNKYLKVINRNSGDDSEWNKAVFTLSRVLRDRFEYEYKERKKKDIESMGNDKLQYYLDNPLNSEEEFKYVRAIFHKMIATGEEFDHQVFDKITNKIGFIGGEDSKIEVVDFGSAFKDIEEAIRLCRMACPVDLTVKSEASV